MFDHMRLSGWRQFRDVTVDFHPQLTILTGANGAGKTTILNVLNRHFGWKIPLVSTPRRRKDIIENFSDWWEGRSQTDATIPGGHRPVGEIKYTSGQRASLSVPEAVEAEYQMSINGQQAIPGLFVSSHRPVFFYQQVGSIPTKPTPRDQLLNVYLNEYRSRYSAGGRIASPSLRLKEALISLAVFGYGNEVVRPNFEYRESFDGFQAILRQVLPPALGFQQLRVEMPEIILETATGDFSLDAVSGGVSAILDLAWQIYMYSSEHDDFVVIVDEPENHLHPELQQTLLPSLLEAFPRTQFVIATHNPFMVNSVPESNVYVLRFDEDRSVVSESLDLVNKAGTANEILRDVLGLDFTLPIWASTRIEAVVEQFASRELSEQSLVDLRTELSELGLGDAFPQTVTRLTRGDDSAN